MVRKIYKRYGALIILLSELVLFSVLSPGFLSYSNLMGIVRQASIIGIVAVGVSIVMIGGNRDMSIGGMMGLLCIVSSMLMIKVGAAIWLAVLITIIVGALLGLISGLFVAFLEVESMILTLGTMTVWTAIAFILSDSHNVSGDLSEFRFLGNGFLGVIPFHVVLFIVIVLLSSFVLHRTYFGKHIYAMGGNVESARLAGIQVKKLKVMTYVISGLLTAVAALVYISRVNVYQPDTGSNYPLDCITAAVIGGVSVRGGEGTILGVVAGTLAITMLGNGLLFLNVNTYYRDLVKGIIMLAVLAAETLEIRHKGKELAE